MKLYKKKYCFYFGESIDLNDIEKIVEKDEIKNFIVLKFYNNNDEQIFRFRNKKDLAIIESIYNKRECLCCNEEINEFDNLKFCKDCKIVFHKKCSKKWKDVYYVKKFVSEFIFLSSNISKDLILELHI